jgi:hypothetical protein
MERTSSRETRSWDIPDPRGDLVLDQIAHQPQCNDQPLPFDNAASPRRNVSCRITGSAPLGAEGAMMVASTKQTEEAKTLTGQARKVVATASGVVKAVGDRLDDEAKTVKGRARKVVASAAGVLKAASVQLDNEAKALQPSVKKPLPPSVKKPAKKAKVSVTKVAAPAKPVKAQAKKVKAPARQSRPTPGSEH